MLIDTTPLLTLSEHTVLAERHEILFHDGTTVGLHQVISNGLPSMFLRCLVHDDVHAMLFDLRQLSRSLGIELQACPARDQRGLVFMTLRLKYHSAAEFAGAVVCVVQAAALLPREPRQRQLQFVSGTSHSEQWLPDAGNRRYWGIPLSSEGSMA
jgi:hypothetical protein